MPGLTIMVKPVSGACNMRCRYCFYSDIMAKRQTGIYPRMTEDMLETLVRRAFRYADGPINFAFQGGEPTLAGLPFYEKLIRLEREYNVRNLPVTNAIQTNGYDLSEEMIDFFARHHFLVGVSLDGIRETHDRMRIDAAGMGTFERVLQNIDRLRNAGVQFNILCVVNDHVAGHPKETFELLAPYGYLQFIACLDDLDGSRKNYSLTDAKYLSFLKETFDLYYRSYKSGRAVSIRTFENYIGILMGYPPENCAMCGRCNAHFLIESDGSVYPCDFYVLDEWRIGSIAEEPFNRLAKAEVAQRFIHESEAVPDKCRACRWYGLCRNGCKRERLPESNLFRWCEVTQRFLEYSYDRMLEIAKAR